MANEEKNWNLETEENPSSFYGRHRKSLMNMEPTVLLEVPINDLYGPHLEFGKVENPTLKF